MISHRLQSTPITGYFEYLSRIRHRVNVALYEGADSEEIRTQTTTTTTVPSSFASLMDNDNTASATNSFPINNSQEQSVNPIDKDVTKWSSTEVQHWVEEQCQKFELKKATTEKFQLNGQALVLLTKHDFLRRSPDGGEILYYALRRLISPDRSNSVRVGQSSTRNGSSGQNTRIVEVDSDSDEHHSVTGSSPTAKPIIEEPDDPPSYFPSDSDTNPENHQHQYYPHSFLHNHAHLHSPIFSMPNGAYYHQHQAFPNAFVYAHHHPHHHVHAHMPQQQFFHPHAQSHAQFIHQYHPMMSAQGIIIEILDNEEANNLTANGVTSSLNGTSTNGASSNAQEQLYLITMNGQRYVMNEEQIRHYITQIQQQHFHQQQQFQQQQQQQQQYTYQQQQTSQDNIFHTS